MIEVSKIVSTLAPSGIRKFFDLVLGMTDVISLGVGEPDFVTPWNIRETAIHAIEQGYTSYTSNKGLFELRLAITNHLKHEYKLDYDPETEILITVGVSEALDLAIRSILNPGDEVIIPEPCYVAYGPVVTLARGKPIFIHTNPDDGFKIRPNDINKACTNKTRALILSYPANPTGTSYTKEELNKLRIAVQKNNLIVISDELYSELTYDFKHTPWPTLKGTKPKCIYLNGFSKSYAMTGWRVGYAVGPKEIIDAMTKIHQYTMLSAPTMSQFAAKEAIQNSQNSVHEMRDEYKRRRNFIVNSLNKMGFRCQLPQGAFYIFCSIESSGMDSVEFANHLLQTYKVAVVPGAAFSHYGDKYIRISYASSMDNLKEAMIRIEKFSRKSTLPIT